jgi:hypothetical protein
MVDPLKSIKGKVSELFNCEIVLRSGGIAPYILDLGTRWR